MPRPSKRSRTLRRVYIKTPSGKNKILYKLRKPKKICCSNCKKELHGVPHDVKSVTRNLPKSSKHPKRIFGGMLCFKCSKLELIKRFRK